MQLVAVLIRKCDGLRMQKQTLESQLFGNPIGLRVTIALVTGQRMAHVLQVYSNLVTARG